MYVVVQAVAQRTGRESSTGPMGRPAAKGDRDRTESGQDRPFAEPPRGLRRGESLLRTDFIRSTRRDRDDLSGSRRPH